MGFSMPAEWCTHSGTELHWPHNRETWPGERLERAEQVYVHLIEVLHRYEPVHLLVADEAVRDRALAKLDRVLARPEFVQIHIQPVNDVWARDCGPIFIRREPENGPAFAITDWGYNAWGGKYPPFDADNHLPAYFSEYFEIPRFEPGMILEGGSIEVNGKGSLLTTESVLLNANRNPEMDKEQIELHLRDYLGVEQIIWLKRGLAGDDTDGHIDDLARFLDENTILTVVAEDPGDVNYDVLQENLEILQQVRKPDGTPFDIVTLPMPVTKIEGTTVDGSEYVPASYANFYIANGVVLLPFYDKKHDGRARELLQTYFPNRDIIGIDCRDLVWGQGSIHCVTQQLYGT